MVTKSDLTENLAGKIEYGECPVLLRRAVGKNCANVSLTC